jgi:histidyl-tRNA synthetase
LEVAGLLDPAEPERFAEERGIVLRAIDKMDRLGADGVRALLGEGRKDESGDFTKGAGLTTLQIEKVLAFVKANELVDSAILNATNGEADQRNPLEGRNAILCHFLREIVDWSKVGREGVNELEEIATLLAAQGYGPDRIVIDPSVVRGLGYYTGPVFEAELTFEITDEKGRPRQFGSVAGGGRYDDLVARFTGQQVPAVGVSIGVDRLLAALHAKGKIGSADRGPVVVTVMDRERMADYQAMVGELRQAGIRAEVYLGNPKNFGNQMKYADRRGSPVAIIAGGDEFAKGVVQIKDLILGAQIAENATVEEWKERPSQYEVPRAGLVDKVREILSEQS